jgi:hypothetical protein
MSLFKNIRLAEHVKLQLRGEAFNVFNHPNALAFNAAITSSSYGRMTSFRDPRIVQMGAKLYF